jgi:hypothetical protein
LYALQTMFDVAPAVNSIVLQRSDAVLKMNGSRPSETSPPTPSLHVAVEYCAQTTEPRRRLAKPCAAWLMACKSNTPNAQTRLSGALAPNGLWSRSPCLSRFRANHEHRAEVRPSHPTPSRSSSPLVASCYVTPCEELPRTHRRITPSLHHSITPSQARILSRCPPRRHPRSYWSASRCGPFHSPEGASSASHCPPRVSPQPWRAADPPPLHPRSAIFALPCLFVAGNTPRRMAIAGKALSAGEPHRRSSRGRRPRW